jgi:hypothetical protein
MKSIALRVNEYSKNQYHIVLPHKCYATMGLFDFIDAHVREQKIKQIMEMSLTEEGYIVLQYCSLEFAQKIANLAGNFILEGILNGAYEWPLTQRAQS